MLSGKPRESLTSQLVRAITERIQLGQYQRGDKLPTEKDFIDEFGVSRTVVREAIANLRASGMVSTKQGIGAFVLQDEGMRSFRIAEENLDLVEDVIRALELRIAIESETAALAAQRRTDAQLAAITAACVAMEAANAAGENTVDKDLAFHRCVTQATGNEHFLSIFNYLGEVLIPRTRLQTHKLDATNMRDYVTRINGEHRMILSAIEARDPDGARAAMRMHLGSSRDRLAQYARAGH